MSVRRRCDARWPKRGLEPTAIDHFFFVTVTGISTPSIDTRIINRLGMRSSVKRTPIFGLGCVAGAAGIARASDYVRAFPNQTAVLLSVELCSLTLQRDDFSLANLIASGLFGDGAAAVVIGGGEHPGPRGPRIIATRSVIYPDTERVMGWDIVESGFKIVLSPRVPEVVEQHLGGDVDVFSGRPRSGARRDPPLDRAHRRTQGVARDRKLARPAVRCAGAILALATGNRQSFLGVGAVRALRSACGQSGEARRLWVADGDGARILFGVGAA